MGLSHTFPYYKNIRTHIFSGEYQRKVTFFCTNKKKKRQNIWNEVRLSYNTKRHTRYGACLYDFDVSG